MPELTLEGRTGNDERAPFEALECLVHSQRGTLNHAEGSDLNEARTLQEAMIDKDPGLIVRCAAVAEVLRDEAGIGKTDWQSHDVATTIVLRRRR